MQPSDVFLMYWAIGATALAVYFYYKMHKFGTAVNAMMIVMHDLAEGKAEIKMVGEDRIQVKKTKE